MSKESLDEKGPGLYHNINMKRKRGEKMRKKGEKRAPSAKEFEKAAKTAKEERELCHSKDHDCATMVEHPQWGKGKPILRSHAIPDDNGYVEWYDVQFKHVIEEKVMAEDMTILYMGSHNKEDGHEDPKKMNKVEYMSAVVMILILKSPISEYYWVSIADKDFPFLGIIEHTNLLPKENYDEKNILYITNYVEDDN